MAKVIITMPDEFLSQVDLVADKEQRSRSELLREAFRAYVGGKKDIQSISLLNKPKVQKALAIQKKIQEKLRGSGWSGTLEIRKWRGEI
ncbi:MAG: ribbon-helix-helix protein, CopG family [bacterium]|nr:ribbon-helix-helix protein, CopG family [bacterium]